MSLSSAEIARALGEIAPWCEGARVGRIRERGGQDLLLELYKEGRRRVLLVSTHPKACRLHFARRPKGTGEEAGPFVQLLRARLAAGGIVRMEQPSGERVVELVIEVPGPSKGPLRLVAELLAHRADVHLYDAGGRRLGSLRGRAPVHKEGSPAPRPRKETVREFPGAPAQGYADRVAAHYEGELARLEAEAARRLLDRAVGSALLRIGRLEKRLESDLERAGTAAAHREKGELLKAYAARVPPRARQCELPAFDDPARGVAIALEPSRSAAQNADDYFTRARKAEHAAGRIARRRRELASRRAGLDALAARLSQEGADLEALAREARELGAALGSAGPKGPGGKDRASRAQRGRRVFEALGIAPRAFLSEAGQDIFVGRNDRENDLLTTRFARPQDYFFHVSGAPGSHVIACVERGARLADATRDQAARLALRYSALSKAARGEVSYAERRYVRKRKGDPPGAVLITAGRKTLWVELGTESGRERPPDKG